MTAPDLVVLESFAEFEYGFLGAAVNSAGFVVLVDLVMRR